MCTLLLVLDQLVFLGGLYPAASRDRGEQRLPVFFVDLGAALVDDPVVSAAGEWHRRLAVLAASCVTQCEGLVGREPLREVDECFVVEISVIVLLCQQINTRDLADAIELELRGDVAAHELLVFIELTEVSSVDPRQVQRESRGVGGSHESHVGLGLFSIILCCCAHGRW